MRVREWPERRLGCHVNKLRAHCIGRGEAEKDLKMENGTNRSYSLIKGRKVISEK